MNNMASVRLPATHRKQQQEVIDRLFKGSIINVCQAFFSEKKVSKKELEEMKKLIDSFDEEE